jgi:hypothetical protein
MKIYYNINKKKMVKLVVIVGVIYYLQINVLVSGLYIILYKTLTLKKWCQQGDQARRSSCQPHSAVVVMLTT